MGGQKLRRSYFEQILIPNFVSVPCHNRKQVTRLIFKKNYAQNSTHHAAFSGPDPAADRIGSTEAFKFMTSLVILRWIFFCTAMSPSDQKRGDPGVVAGCRIIRKNSERRWKQDSLNKCKGNQLPFLVNSPALRLHVCVVIGAQGLLARCHRGVRPTWGSSRGWRAGSSTSPPPIMDRHRQLVQPEAAAPSHSSSSIESQNCSDNLQLSQESINCGSSSREVELKAC